MKINYLVVQDVERRIMLTDEILVYLKTLFQLHRL
jgi:hypothetical protein